MCQIVWGCSERKKWTKIVEVQVFRVKKFWKMQRSYIAMAKDDKRSRSLEFRRTRNSKDTIFHKYISQKNDRPLIKMSVLG